MKQLKEIISNLPSTPGVYRYYDKKDNLLYIGKAKSLKNRVSSYFQNSKAHNQRITLMVSLIERIEYTKVKTEKEALILEANLINSLQPKYNVALKDDKSYVYIEYTKADPIPGFFVVRRKENKDSIYYGPYTNTKEVKDVMKVLRSVFPYCQNRFSNNKPCEYVSIKQCNGICCGLESKETYLEHNQSIINILNGRVGVAQHSILAKIDEFIKIENYELAAFYRNQLLILKSLTEKQKIVLKVAEDIDLINLVYQNNPDGEIIGSFFVQQIRDGRIVNVFNSILAGTNIDDNYSQLLDSFLYQYSTINGYNIPLLWSISEYNSSHLPELS